jgi:hypothetical protein
MKSLKVVHHPDNDGTKFSDVQTEIENLRTANALTCVSADAVFTAVNQLLRSAGSARKAKGTNNTYSDDHDNLILGGTAAGTSAVCCLVLINGTAPSATVSGVHLFSVGGVAQVYDGAGNTILLDNHLLHSNTSSMLTVGFVDTEFDNGTKSSGTLTPDPANGNFQKVVNGGAFTLAPPSASGSYTIVLDVTNNGSAGTITSSSFTKQTGSAFDTTNAHAFRCYISKCTAGTHLHVQAMQ